MKKLITIFGAIVLFSLHSFSEDTNVKKGSYEGTAIVRVDLKIKSTFTCMAIGCPAARIYTQVVLTVIESDEVLGPIYGPVFYDFPREIELGGIEIRTGDILYVEGIFHTQSILPFTTLEKINFAELM